MEEDTKAEEDAFETFVCWAKSITDQKTASNSAAQTRADYLETYISDLTNGRIELTSERGDLEKEIKAVTEDIEVAGQMRQKGAADFAMAKEEMDAAIAAMDNAIGVLRTATQNHTQGVLMSLKGALSETATVRAQEAASLQRAVELGRKVLTKGDALFLQRVLTGTVPERASWKKLNRKATHKMNYKARSFKIQEVMANLLETFNSNLADAADKEGKEIQLYNKLMLAKNAAKQAAELALNKMDKETGSRQLALSDANEEKNGLTKQITDDTGYISQVATSLSNKKADWKVRQKLRTDEIAAFSQAISILHSDEARDTFKHSFSSFLQESMTQSSSQQMHSAVQVLRLAAEMSKDARLANIAVMANSSQFVEVVQAIDSMLSVLKSEETSDLTNKETCEQNRGTDTRDAVSKSREMDDLTDEVTSLTAKIADLHAEITEKEARVVAITQELEDARIQREDENKAYLAGKQADQDAQQLITNAKTVLSQFYSTNNLVLVQGKGAKAPVDVAGQAPPPPPATWEAPYGGKTAESGGIQAILQMIHDDISADMLKATNEEQAAVTLYGTTKTNLENERTGLQTSIGLLTIEAGGHQTDITTALTGRGTKKGELSAVMIRITGAEPDCDFIAINFQVRSQNRQTEIDGLGKAKAILSGATFHGLPDPNRELKPNDAALVQHARRKFLRSRA